MAVYTIASTNITNDILDALVDAGGSGDDFPEARLNRYIERAVRLYSGLKPYRRTGTLTTVADQDVYSLPSDCMTLVDCQYRNSTVEEWKEYTDELFPFMHADYDYPALTLVRNALLHAYDTVGQGYWKQITVPTSLQAGQRVMLYPPPDDSGDSIDIVYWAQHPLVASDYPTIPDWHVPHIVDLVVSYGLERLATEIDKGPHDFDEGQTRVRWMGGGNNLRRAAYRLRQRVMDTLTPPLLQRSDDFGA